VLVPTPIGNLEDITLRAIRTLNEADAVLAEDTRVARLLLQHLNVRKPLLAFHMHNEHAALHPILERLAQGSCLALTSDAGTPGISDPGFLLVRACVKAGIPVETLPGPTAFVPALVSSGLPCDRFAFEGFLPPKKGRATRLRALAQETRTVVLYESPLRTPRLLQELLETCGPARQVCIARELSKMHEEYLRGTLQEMHARVGATPLRGEVVVVLQGAEA
jgi:16S rRNA (cytidine1402-2'-O)-methyltransferase